MEPVLKIENLTKRYGKTSALDRLDFQLEKGQFCGFVGPNGAGKSTTIRTILGLLPIQQGTVLWNGEPLSTHTKNHIGYCPSEALFPEDLRGKDILHLTARLHRKKCAAEAAALCRQLDFDPDKKVRQLSLGNRKKLAIINALQTDPDILILDEATNGLDPLVRQTLFQLLKERNEKGCTILFSSHNLQEVEAHCDRIVGIHNGTIVLDRDKNSPIQDRQWNITCKEKGQKQETAFSFKGQADELIRQLAETTLEDITITHPGLEEQFMNLYEEDRHDHHTA